MLSLRLPFATLALAAVLSAAPARAGIEACGNIDVTADAQCKVLADEDCVAQCTPPKLVAACAAKLEASCETTCDHLPEVSCTGDCQGTCEADCNVKPAEFDCEGNCNATCEGDCSSKCSSSDDTTTCEAQCKATCSSQCHGSCTATPAEADCTGKCEASCKGSCTVDTNFDCQTMCQGEGFAKCQADLQEGSCQVQCTKPEGAIFCDGQFVDNGGNAQKCINALKDYLNSHVVANASGTAACSGGVCTAEGEGKVSCHCSTLARRSGSTPLGFAIAGVLGLLGVARLRRR